MTTREPAVKVTLPKSNADEEVYALRLLIFRLAEPPEASTARSPAVSLPEPAMPASSELPAPRVTLPTVPVPRRTPEPETEAAPIEPVTLRVPAVTEVPPPKVLVPERVRTPAPDLARVAVVPARLAEMEAAAELATVKESPVRVAEPVMEPELRVRPATVWSLDERARVPPPRVMLPESREAEPTERIPALTEVPPVWPRALVRLAVPRPCLVRVDEPAVATPNPRLAPSPASMVTPEVAVRTPDPEVTEPEVREREATVSELSPKASSPPLTVTAPESARVLVALPRMSLPVVTVVPPV